MCSHRLLTHWHRQPILLQNNTSTQITMYCKIFNRSTFSKHVIECLMFDVDLELYDCFQFIVLHYSHFVLLLMVVVLLFLFRLRLRLLLHIVWLYRYCCHPTIDEKLILSLQSCVRLIGALILKKKILIIYRLPFSRIHYYSWTIFITNVLYTSMLFGQVGFTETGPLEWDCSWQRQSSGRKKKHTHTHREKKNEGGQVLNTWSQLYKMYININKWIHA